MVNSARQSIGDFYGLEYEFVLVDGNSTDGTQDWTSSQPDIRLIQHASLLGAVQAFNDGAFAAKGDYIILANDDIEFLGETIYLGWNYMQQHPDCGIGCFYQDRNGRDFHIEEMPVVRNGMQAHEPYGQVCIVPKWLGDYVGWWGAKEKKYLHTYGGDNEISSNIYELGFRVSPVPNTKIHDSEIDDELRRKNNLNGAKDPRAVRGHHPDSWAWGQKWRNHRQNLVGPVIKDTPQLEQQTMIKERIVYLPIYEQGWAIQKEQKRGLRDALAKVGLVAEFDYVSMFAEHGKRFTMVKLQNLIQKMQPTLILTQIHNGDQINASDIAMLKLMTPNAKFVNWNGDYWLDNYYSEDGIKLARSFDLMTTVNREVYEKYTEMGINAAYWQIGFEPDGIGFEPDEYHDIVFLASGYSQARQKLGKQLQALNRYSVGLYGTGWPNGYSKGQNLYNFKEACRVYRGAKISIGDSQWPDSGFVSNRVMQALAAGGSALAHQWFRGMDELGLVDSETCIIWQDFKELKQKIKYYLSHENERLKIAQAGEKLALERHSFDARVKELFELLQTEDLEIGWR